MEERCGQDVTEIVFQSVTKSLGGRVVVQDVSFALAPSERVALVGASGSGKTTVLRLAAGLLVPDQGRILVDGVPVAEAGRNRVAPEQRHIGMVFQDLALWPHLTVEGNLAFGLKARGVAPAERRGRIMEMLERVHLQQHARTLPAALSGGEQQRVALARALVLHPQILLMDEPLSSLDLRLNLALRQEILVLHQALQFTLLYVTHGLEEAQQIGQRILEINERGIETRNGNHGEADAQT